MNEKEIADIRRRYRWARNSITHICGCFVNENKEIVSEFRHSVGMMNEEEADQLLGLMKKTLSGALGRNLIELEFSTQQVMESEEHRLLAMLRATKLNDDELIRSLYQKVIESLEIQGNYVILLAHDNYDLYAYSADGEKGASGEVFSYILCSICPIKAGKPVMSYYIPGNCFRTVCADTMISRPALGFMFPALEDGAANIYKTLYYTKDLCNSHTELTDALFGSTLPMPAAAQKETFGTVLEQAMEEDCSLKVVRAVQNQVRQMIEAQKEEKSEEPLRVTKEIAGDMLRCCGVPEERIEVFEEKYEQEFGEKAELVPKNLVESNRMQVKTPEVTINVQAENAGVIETRVIDGARYIMIRADHDVQVNGVYIQI